MAGRASGPLGDRLLFLVQTHKPYMSGKVIFLRGRVLASAPQVGWENRRLIEIVAKFTKKLVIARSNAGVSDLISSIKC